MPKTKVQLFDQSLLFALLAFVVLLGLYFVGLRKPELAGANTATMIISFDDQNQRIFRGPVVENMTVLEALFAATQKKDSNIKIVYHVEEDGDVNLSAINDRVSLDGHGWTFYVNDIAIETKDINKIYVNVGDIIEARYN